MRNISCNGLTRNIFKSIFEANISYFRNSHMSETETYFTYTVIYQEIDCPDAFGLFKHEPRIKNIGRSAQRIGDNVA